MRLNGAMNKLKAMERKIADRPDVYTSGISIEHLLDKYKVYEDADDNSELSKQADRMMDRVLAHAKEWRERRR